jgi:hypothetical protein
MSRVGISPIPMGQTCWCDPGERRAFAGRSPIRLRTRNGDGRETGTDAKRGRTRNADASVFLSGTGKADASDASPLFSPSPLFSLPARRDVVPSSGVGPRYNGLPAGMAVGPCGVGTCREWSDESQTVQAGDDHSPPADGEQRVRGPRRWRSRPPAGRRRRPRKRCRSRRPFQGSPSPTAADGRSEGDAVLPPVGLIRRLRGRRLVLAGLCTRREDSVGFWSLFSPRRSPRAL